MTLLLDLLTKRVVEPPIGVGRVVLRLLMGEPEEGEGFHVCSKCGVAKAAEEFYTRKRADGSLRRRMTWCKACHRAITSENNRARRNAPGRFITGHEPAQEVTQ